MANLGIMLGVLAIMFSIVGTVIGMGSPKAPSNDCTIQTCYVNPSYWAITQNQEAGNGICTTSASYVDADNAAYVVLTTPSSPPVKPQSTFWEYVTYDFDIHITILGTSGKLSIFDNDLGLGTALSREISISGFGANVEESASLQITGGFNVGAGVTDHFGLEIYRTGGTGSVCLDDWEGSGFVLASGGSVA